MGQLLPCGECGKRGVRHSADSLVCRYCKHTHPLPVHGSATVNRAGSAQTTMSQAPPRSPGKSTGAGGMVLGLVMAGLIALGGILVSNHEAAPSPPHQTVNQAPPSSCSRQATTTLPDGTTYCSYRPYPDTGPYKPCVPHSKKARRRFHGVCRSKGGATASDDG